MTIVVSNPESYVKYEIEFYINIVVICKEPHIQVGVGSMVTSGSLHHVMVAHWPRAPQMWVRFLL